MPFIIVNNIVVSFATFQDVLSIEERLFAMNEGISSLEIESNLRRSTTRILNKLKASDWWKTYTDSSVPESLDTSLILREDDFTDLCIYFCMYQYIFHRTESRIQLKAR